jgi:inward rectifier potassium channel
MEQPKPAFDPGLTQQYTGALTRAINENGQFNVRRPGLTLRDIHPYLFLVSVRLPVFIGIIAVSFIVVNLLFAGVYMAIGIDHLKGAEAATVEGEFLNAFFFSTHTLTTVGYGNIYPVGVAATSIAAIEALIGLMTFALATGLLFGRFARPSARIGFSNHILVAPYRDGTSLQFRIVNRRSNNLLELGARVMLMTVEMVDGRLQRKFAQLELERDQVIFFPLTWTIVHPITSASPLYGKTDADLAELQGEVLVFVKAFDETFGQTVNSRRSYRYSEIVWGAKFTPAFEVERSGDLRLDVAKVSNFETVSLSRVTE